MTFYPHCDADHKLNFTPESNISNAKERAFYVGALYLFIGCFGLPANCFVLYAFVQPALRKQHVFKLLSITSVLDILNIITACFVSGLASLFNKSYCSKGWGWLHPYSIYFMGHWYAYCAASELLALDRLLVFTYPKLAQLLFSGHKPWYWLIYIVGYAVVGTCMQPSMFYVYGPATGAFIDGFENRFHIFNNFFKLAVVTTSYMIMIVSIVKIKRGLQYVAQRSLSILTFIVATFGSISTVGYLAVSYLPHTTLVGRYSGVIGQLGWILLHTFTGFVYLFGNKIVREQFQSVMFCKKIALIKSDETPLDNRNAYPATRRIIWRQKPSLAFTRCSFNI